MGWAGCYSQNVSRFLCDFLGTIKMGNQYFTGPHLNSCVCVCVCLPFPSFILYLQCLSGRVVDVLILGTLYSKNLAPYPIARTSRTRRAIFRCSMNSLAVPEPVPISHPAFLFASLLLSAFSFSFSFSRDKVLLCSLRLAWNLLCISDWL